MFRSIFCLLLPIFLKAETIYTFIETRGKSSQEIIWKESILENGDILFKGLRKEGETEAHFTKNYELVKYSFISSEETYEFRKEGDVVITSLQKGNKKEAKKLPLSKEHWIQQFWFGFKPFLDSKASSQKFALVNPDTLEKVKMVVSKEKKEALTIGRSVYEALRLKVTLQGFKSVFWSAAIWFDAKTHEFLRYEANEGPNTETTIIEKKSM